MDIHPFTGGASTVGKMSVALPMTLSHCLTQNLTRGFAQLAVVRISWWVLLLRKMAGALGPGSPQFPTSPPGVPGGGFAIFPTHPEWCGFAEGVTGLWGGGVIFRKSRPPPA